MTNIKNYKKNGFYIFIAIVLLFVHGCTSKYMITSPKYAEFPGEINQHGRLIQSDKTRIFQILTNDESFKKVCPKGTIVSYEPPFPYKVGTLIKTRIDHIFKLEWNSQVYEIIPDKKIRIQFLSGFFAGSGRGGCASAFLSRRGMPKAIVAAAAHVTKPYFSFLKPRLNKPDLEFFIDFSASLRKDLMQ